MLIIDQSFAGFLINYFSTHIRWKFGIRVLKIIPSALICEEKYQKISFHKVIQNWLFNMEARTKAFFFSFFLFLSPHFTSIFSFFFFFFSSFFFSLFFFCFSWWTRWIHFRKAEVESTRWKLKVNSEIWSSWLIIFSYFSFFLSHSSIR